MQQESHNKEDVRCKIIKNEENWFIRGIQEAIEIRRRKPTLNADNGRFYLSEIWTNIISQSEEENGNNRHRLFPS